METSCKGQDSGRRVNPKRGRGHGKEASQRAIEGKWSFRPIWRINSNLLTGKPTDTCVINPRYLSVYPSIYMYIYISIYLSISTSTSIYLYLYAPASSLRWPSAERKVRAAAIYISISIYLYLYLYLYLSIYIYMCVCVCVCVCVRVCVCVCAYLPIYLSIYIGAVNP